MAVWPYFSVLLKHVDVFVGSDGSDGFQRTGPDQPSSSSDSAQQPPAGVGQQTGSGGRLQQEEPVCVPPLPFLPAVLFLIRQGAGPEKEEEESGRRRRDPSDAAAAAAARRRRGYGKSDRVGQESNQSGGDGQVPISPGWLPVYRGLYDVTAGSQQNYTVLTI